MDASVQRLLTDKLYDKRKQGALELEKLVRESVANKDRDRINKIIHQLCHDFAYAVHAPHARNGGLIGLAAASIALGSDEVARHLAEIVPPVLACFTDQDARVRYYACESMYNISKVAKGEVLVYFNDIFDALCKLSADTELSVKNGAELLDRLVKDIVSESAATYVSILHFDEKDERGSPHTDEEFRAAFSLANFIPLLEERIHVTNPFARTFLVSWLTLLDTIPDLELVHWLPAFLGGLFKFLGDQSRDVYVATQGLLDRLLGEIVKIAKVKRGIAENRQSRLSANRRMSESQAATGSLVGSAGDENAINDSESGSGDDEDEGYDDSAGDWIPGQDVQIDHAAILDILLKFVDPSSTKESSSTLRLEGLSKQKEEEIGIVALRWIATFFEVASDDILAFVPRLLSQVLPALSSQSEQFRSQAVSVNHALMDYIVNYHDDLDLYEPANPPAPTRTSTEIIAPYLPHSRQQSIAGEKISPAQPPSSSQELSQQQTTEEETASPDKLDAPQSESGLDYAAAVSALQEQFLNEDEETRVGALSWLIMLQKKAPQKVMASNDGTFPVLLKTLSDPAEAVVIKDLQLLSQISKNSADNNFSFFMVSLMQLFATDRKLLEIRGNLIIRQLCINLEPDRIYRTLAECIEKDKDIEFASIMVQNLNNNLITAPELSTLRKKLRNLDNREGQAFFVALFRAWCYNAVATFSLCLLAQAYEQAYNLLQVFADLEMTVNILIQIDKLVQLLESPVFTYLRLQLLEPDRYPFLYKCLYGLLMLLPQSSAFAALKNRLNSVSNIGTLHTPTPTPLSARPNNPTTSTLTNTTSTPSNTVSRLSRRDPVGGPSAAEVRWPELLEKFRTTQQERVSRHNDRITRADDYDANGSNARRPGSNLSNGPRDGSDPGFGGGVRGGRTSRASIEIGRPGSGLSMEGGVGGRNGAGGVGNAGGRRTGIGSAYQTGAGSSSTGVGASNTRGPVNGPGPAVVGGAGADKGPGNAKSRHSLMGKFGLSKGANRDRKDGNGPGGAGAGASAGAGTGMGTGTGAGTGTMGAGLKK